MRILMIGPVPRIYGGISAVTGAILDSDLPRRQQLIYVAEGTRQGPVAKLVRFLAASWRVCWLVLGRRVDVVHQHVGDGGSFYRHVFYLALGRLAGVPVVFHWHLPGDARAATDFYNAGRPWQPWLVRRALDSASRVVVLSESWRPALARITANAHVEALPNPVNCAAIHPALSKEADPSGQPLILFLGDFSVRKGVRDLLAAAPAILQRHPAARFVLCGADPPADVQALARPLGQAVRFPGFVRGAEKLQLLQQAALLALPSYAEGLSIAVLEGMAAGLPVVTTPVGGTLDVFRDGENGLLVQPGDISGLEEAINRLLDQPDLGRRMGRRNRQQALAQFDVPVYVEQLLALYSSVVHDPQR